MFDDHWVRSMIVTSVRGVIPLTYGKQKRFNRDIRSDYWSTGRGGITRDVWTRVGWELFTGFRKRFSRGRGSGKFLELLDDVGEMVILTESTFSSIVTCRL